MCPMCFRITLKKFRIFRHRKSYMRLPRENRQMLPRYGMGGGLKEVMYAVKTNISALNVKKQNGEQARPD